MSKVKLSIFLRISVSLTLLGLLLWLARENFAKICQLLCSVNISIFLLGLTIFLLGIAFMAWRLKLVLAAQKALFALRDLFSLTLIGQFFSNFMPTSIGGDLVKGYYISKRNRKLTAYTSVFFDRVIGMLSVSLIAALTLIIIREDVVHKFIIWTIAFLLFSIAIFIFFIFQEKLLQRIGRSTGIARLLQILKLDQTIKKTYSALTVYTNQKKIVTQAVILSAIGQFINFYSIFLLSKSLSINIALEKILLVMPVIFILCMLPVTMNGLGLREWAFVFFFSPNIGDAAALSLSLLYLTMFLLTSLIGGIIYLFWR